MDDSFSFLKEEFAPKQKSTRRQSLRQMRYSTICQKNISLCQTLTLPRYYVGKLGDKWTFPSDHLPVGANCRTFNVATWNVLNPAYLFWILRDKQGLANSSVLKAKNRTELIVEKIFQTLLHDTAPKQLLALQECSVELIEIVKKKLPSYYEILHKETFCIQSCLALIYDKRFFSLKTLSFQYPFFLDTHHEIIDAIFNHHDEEFRVINTHIPADPRLPSRYELAKYIENHPSHQMLVLGDMNFNQWEMEECFLKSSLELTCCHTGYPTNIGYDLYAKQIDFIFTSPNLMPQGLKADEVLNDLETHIDIMKKAPLCEKEG
ncbi:MAG: hypothetical protein FJZ56_04840 [Chlamydiae bacterium]|nr:hypothetical protein [Chlamydiota bacterium]